MNADLDVPVLVLAHGIGGRQDLPIPLGFALTGAGLAVLVSFVVIAVWWKGSRLRGDAAGRPLPDRLARALDSAAVRVGLRALGLAATAFFFVAAAYGPADSLVSTAPGIVYVFFWVGLVPLSMVFGPVWKLLNPLRTLHLLITRIAGVPVELGVVGLPARIGYWPAAAGLLAFTWLELVAPASDQPRVLLVFFVAYTVLHLVAAAMFGSRWFDRADASRRTRRSRGASRRSVAVPTGSWCGATRSMVWTGCGSTPGWSPWCACGWARRPSTGSPARWCGRAC